ncbi:MAG: peptidase C15 [Cyanobacteria bacterium P01_H01_bin.121]
MQAWLLTSFATWLPHQRSNASDDLLQALLDAGQVPEHCQLLRRLPVDTTAAFQLVRDRIQVRQPQGVICCGMAETRSYLSLEVQACHAEHRLKTTLDVADLTKTLSATRISYDAGQFVCNDLYHALLAYSQTVMLPHHVLFVHVPPKDASLWAQVVSDFSALLQRLSCQPLVSTESIYVRR